jgi:hypothetical protein
MPSGLTTLTKTRKRKVEEASEDKMNKTRKATTRVREEELLQRQLEATVIVGDIALERNTETAGGEE